MALSVTEAIAVGRVLRRLAPNAYRGDPQRSVDIELREAAAELADAAHKKLAAGPTGDDIRAAWGMR